MIILALLIFFGMAPDASAWQDADITDIRFGVHEDYARVVFDIRRELAYRIDRDNRGNIVVDFPRGKVSSSLKRDLRINDGAVEEIKIDGIGKGTRARILLGKSSGSFKAHLFKNPYRLVLDIQKSNVIRTGLHKKDNKIEVVVIDAGHGGKDPGAIGRRGLKEKNVTLDIARRIENLLDREGKVKVVMTRQSDTFVTLDNRVKTANKNRGGLFVSIHTNSHSRKSAGGFETFYLGETKTSEAKSVAILENSVLELEKPLFLDLDKTLDKILWDLRRDEFKVESREFAEVVQGNLDRRLALRNRGVKGALLYVLRGTAMPAVLVETAFISNPSEESLLRRASFRQTVAQAIHTSILQYKNRFEESGGFTD